MARFLMPGGIGERAALFSEGGSHEDALEAAREAAALHGPLAQVEFKA